MERHLRVLLVACTLDTVNTEIDVSICVMFVWVKCLCSRHAGLGARLLEHLLWPPHRPLHSRRASFATCNLASVA